MRFGRKKEKRLAPKTKDVKNWCNNEERPYELDLLKREVYSCNRLHQLEQTKYVQKTKKIRCPTCNKRLAPKAIWCSGGEFRYWILPSHKEK